MLILDTDHFSIFRRNPERLEERLVNSGREVAISIVTVEEAMRGWLAQIHKVRTPSEELEPYGRLFRFVRSLENWEIVPMDENCIRVWENLRAQRIRIGSMDLKIAASARQSLGDFMQRGQAQRPTGSLFPDIPVISHEKDWGLIPEATSNAIQAERTERHRNWNKKKTRQRKKK